MESLVTPTKKRKQNNKNALEWSGNRKDDASE